MYVLPSVCIVTENYFNAFFKNVFTVILCFYLYVCMHSQANDWEPERKKIEMKKPFCLRVFIYQCKDLPAVDDNYLIDPYIKVCTYVCK